MGSLKRRVDCLEADRGKTTPVPETPLMREVREIDEEVRRLDWEIAVIEVGTPEDEHRRVVEDDEAFMASLSGIDLDGKIRAIEREIDRMERGSWEA